MIPAIGMASWVSVLCIIKRIFAKNSEVFTTATNVSHLGYLAQNKIEQK